MSLIAFSIRATDLAQRAWPDEDAKSRALRDPLLARLLEECGELAGALRDYDGRSIRPDKPAGTKEHAQEEIGDALVILLRLATIYEINPETALRCALDKFQARVQAVEAKQAA